MHTVAWHGLALLQFACPTLSQPPPVSHQQTRFCHIHLAPVFLTLACYTQALNHLQHNNRHTVAEFQRWTPSAPAVRWANFCPATPHTPVAFRVALSCPTLWPPPDYLSVTYSVLLFNSNIQGCQTGCSNMLPAMFGDGSCLVVWEAA